MARLVAQSRRSTETRQQETTTPRDAIAQVAYELFERRGRVHGFDQQDWFEAERIVQTRQRSS